MKLRDLLRGLSRPDVAGTGGVNGAYPRPRLISPTPQPEPLARRRDRLIAEEAEAEARLLAVRSALDDVTTELMGEARGSIEQTRIRGLASLFEMQLASFARYASPAVMAKIFRTMLNPPAPVPALHPGPAQPSGRIDPVALAKAISAAGKKASNETEEELPTDPVARQIVEAGRSAMGWQPKKRRD
jgi:hypothetical protein